MRLVTGNGLALHPGYERDGIPVFFEDDHTLIEPATAWILKIAKLKSRSQNTTRKYAGILARYLQWLDDCGYGANAWATIDEDIFDEYLLHISKPADGAMFGPAHGTLLDYASRIYGFYKWAQARGYQHALDIEEEDLAIKIGEQSLLAHIGMKVNVTKLDFNLPTGRPALYQQELDKFVNQQDYEVALHFLDDIVYRIMAVIIRITALRPKDLLQLPYRGSQQNSGFVPYDVDQIPKDLHTRNMNYTFESKGKIRSINFPGKLWAVICKSYIPLRRERALLYAKVHGVSPPNSKLFLTPDGLVVNYAILYYHFSRVPELAKAAGPLNDGRSFQGRKFSARMLRHSCATYFVYEALKRKNMLGRSFVYDAALDDELRKLMGHTDVRTTLEYYVHLANRFAHDDLIADLQRSEVDVGLNEFLKHIDY
ncbi:MAG: site-specific integrase [Betaproteobacteria bacterium]|nr:site-specific integrase [Betaproteobacteria bacterium]